MAHTFFRTFGLTKPSDADIVDFCDALDLNERTELAGLHALYSEPVLIFLEDIGGNVIAFYANSGLNVISHYPETRTIFEALLGASKTIFLAYKPERFFRPHMRNSLAGRFFQPENFRFDSLIEAAVTATHLKVTEAPIVFKKADIPDLYPYVRTSETSFDINQIQNAVMKPVPLALTEKAAFPTVFSSKPATSQASSESASSTVTSNNVTAEGLQSLFVRNPLACARFARAVRDSGLPVPAETKSNSMKAASYLANEAADYVLKALLAKNPEVGARIARQALKDYSEIDSISETDHIDSKSEPTSDHELVPPTTHISAPTSTDIPAPGSTHVSDSTSVHMPESMSTHVPTPESTLTPETITTLIPVATTAHVPESGPSQLQTIITTPVQIPMSTDTPTFTDTEGSSTASTHSTTAPTVTSSTHSHNDTSVVLRPEPQIYMYDPISTKMYKLVSDDGTFPAFITGNSSVSGTLPHDTVKSRTTEPKKPQETKYDSHKLANNHKYKSMSPMKETKLYNNIYSKQETASDDHKTGFKAHSKQHSKESTPHEFLKRLTAGLPQVTHQFANVGHLLNAINAMAVED